MIYVDTVDRIDARSRAAWKSHSLFMPHPSGQDSEQPRFGDEASLSVAFTARRVLFPGLATFLPDLVYNK